MLDTFCMQVNVPHSKFGACRYFIPEPLRTWLQNNELHEWSYTGGSCWGDMDSHRESHYMVKNIMDKEVATVFKIMFPECTVYVSNEYDYA